MSFRQPDSLIAKYTFWEDISSEGLYCEVSHCSGIGKFRAHMLGDLSESQLREAFYFMNWAAILCKTHYNTVNTITPKTDIEFVEAWRAVPEQLANEIKKEFVYAST